MEENQINVGDTIQTLKKIPVQRYKHVTGVVYKTETEPNGTVNYYVKDDIGNLYAFQAGYIKVIDKLEDTI